MTTWAILATGPSMSQSAADQVRGRCKVIAVSDAFRLAPWADAMASVDASWWKHNPAALGFAGRRFTAAPDFQGLSELERLPGVVNGTNSGLFAMMAAVHLGAKRLLLFGFDMRGTHYFGPHKTLRNPSPQRFEVFKRQFSQYKPRGVDIVNVTVGSSLKCYSMGDLEDCLAESALHAA